MIVISAPMGAKGHQVGRLLASSDDVVWYNNVANGEHPWQPYVEKELYGIDANFTKFHWNRRFKDGLSIPPVLDMAERQGLYTGKYEALKGPIEQFQPKHLMYALHGPLDKTKAFFEGAKHIVIIPKDKARLLARYCQTSAKYYVNPEEKSKTFYDLFEGNYMNMLEHLERVIDNYSRFVSEDDIIITDPDKFFTEENFKKVCNKFELSFNKTNFDKVLNFLKS